MVSPVHRFQSAQGDVGVDLGRGDIRVAEKGLYSAEIGSVFHHVGRAAMTQNVGAGAGIQSLYQLPHPLAGEGRSAHGQEETPVAWSRAAGHQTWPAAG